jgi:hypothetical protein
MSEIKQVTVALSHPDELNPRRRKRTRKFKDDIESQSGGSSPAAPADAEAANPGQQVTVQKEIPTTTVSSNQTVVPVQNAIPVQPTPSLAAVTMVGGGAPGAVHILEKKNVNGVSKDPGNKFNGESNAPNAPKIVPHKKRLANAPSSQTMKKPKFIVSAAAPVTPSEKTHVHPAPKNETISGGVGSGGMDLKLAKGGVVTQGGLKPLNRRKFTERRIKIEVKHIVKTRKSRKLLRERIDAMPIQAVRRLLIKKGILKPKSTLPPEPMMRSMLHDYYLLKQRE